MKKARSLGNSRFLTLRSTGDERIELIKQELYTGHIGDGKIFVYDITNVIRVRTGDEGVDAL